MTIRLALAITLLLLATCHGASARQFRVLHSFCAQTNCTDGELPLSGLIADGEGNLYGTTEGGGQVVFELVRSDHGNWTYQVLHASCSEKNCTDGLTPHGPLVMDTAGNLFGTTIGAISTIFELSPDSDHTHWTFKTLYTFCVFRGNDHPCNHRSDRATSALTYAGQAFGKSYDGKSPLYGYGESTFADSSFRNFVYHYSPNHSVVQIFRTCVFPSHSCPGLRGDPLLDNSGSLYGTTSSGGQFGAGIAFALDVTKGTETLLHDFCSQPQCSDGGQPMGGLMLDASGNLYGNAFGGSPTSYCQNAGFEQCGIVYRLAPQDGQYEYSILHDLCGKPNCSDGIDPEFGLIQDSAGALYGVTQAGGGTKSTKSAGTVFEAGGTLRALHHFCSEANCGDGAYPNGPLLMDAKGNLFGTTNEGGAYSDLPNVYGGTIFEITN